MKLTKMSFWVFAAILAAAGSGARGQSGSTEPITVLDGRCDYPSNLAPTARELRLDCKSAVLMPGRGATDVLVQFVTDKDEVYGFAGPVSGDLLTIKRIYLPGPKVIPAGGQCKIFVRDDGIHGVACVGNAQGATYVANIEVTAAHRA